MTKITLDGDASYFDATFNEALRRGDVWVLAALVGKHPESVPSDIRFHGRFTKLFENPDSMAALVAAVGTQKEALKLLGYGYAIPGEPPKNSLETHEQHVFSWLFPLMQDWEGYAWSVDVDGYSEDHGSEDNVEDTFESIERAMGFYPGWNGDSAFSEDGRTLTITLVRYDDEYDDDEEGEVNIITVTRIDGEPFTKRERRSLVWGW